MVIILCGFSGAGKSFLAENLKKLIPDFEFFDTDDLILKTVSKKFQTLEEYIEQSGWDEFRNTERRVIDKLINSSEDENIFVSLGGGSLSESLLSEIQRREKSKLFWLDTDFELCWKRIAGDRSRPLTKKGREFLKDLYEERKPLYQKSEFRIPVSSEDEARNAAKVLLKELRLDTSL